MKSNIQIYDYVDNANTQGIARAGLNNKYFHIDVKTGKPLYSQKYGWVSEANSQGIAVVELNNKFFHIDVKTGEPLYS